MGIINWFKDKIILKMEHDIALLYAKMDGLEMQIENLKGQIQSVRTMRRKKLSEEGEEEGENPNLDEIRKAFGGDIPIEFSERMRRQQ